jgi:hypothetical protein
MRSTCMDGILRTSNTTTMKGDRECVQTNFGTSENVPYHRSCLVWYLLCCGTCLHFDKARLPPAGYDRRSRTLCGGKHETKVKR